MVGAMAQTTCSRKEEQPECKKLQEPSELKCSCSESADQEEPETEECVRDIARGAVISGLTYGAVRLVAPTDHTEDIVDMAHSLLSSGTAFYGLSQMVPHSVHLRALPPSLASGRGLVVKMFSSSLGYFLADAIKIAFDVLLRGKYPHLWGGRLIHHTVQLGANFPGIFGKGQPSEQNLAWRSVLCMAYIAEFSSVFLRLSNLVRNGPSIRLRLLTNWALVASFFGSRIVNFALAIAMFIKARPALPPSLFKLGATVQVGGYALSAVWFAKIVRIALKTPGLAPVPSVEC